MNLGIIHQCKTSRAETRAKSEPTSQTSARQCHISSNGSRSSLAAFRFEYNSNSATDSWHWGYVNQYGYRWILLVDMS